MKVRAIVYELGQGKKEGSAWWYPTAMFRSQEDALYFTRDFSKSFVKVRLIGE